MRMNRVKVLGQRIWQFDKAPAGPVVFHPEREDGADGVGLRFEGIRVEGGRAVVDVKEVHPVQIVVHGRRRKASCLPRGEIAVDLAGPFLEDFVGAKQLAVVFEPVHTDFKARFPQAVVKPIGIAIAFGHKIKEDRKPRDCSMSASCTQESCPFCVSTSWLQNKRKLFALRPAGPADGRLGRRGGLSATHAECLAPPFDDGFAEQQLQSAWKERLEGVEQIPRHGHEVSRAELLDDVIG